MDNQTATELKTALQNEHDRIVAELRPIAKEDPAQQGNWNSIFPRFEDVEYGSHSAEEGEADEVEEYEVRLAAEHSLESRLLEVNKAMERMRQNTYGRCTRCQSNIALDRLHANPAAEFCSNHSGA